MSKEILSKTRWSILVLATALCAEQVRADGTVYVSISGFSPSSITVGVGETVYFVVDDDLGPYLLQSTTGAWTPWYLFDYQDYVGIKFNQKGDYYYRDGFSYKTGVVHVQDAVPNVPPVASITSPADGAVFNEPASFTLSVDATDPDGAITLVECYVDSNLVDNLYAAPFSTQVTNLAAGNHVLSVTVYDTAAAAVTKTVNITVRRGTGPTVTLRPPRLVGGQIEFEAAGLTVGHQVVLETSANLGLSATWLPVQTNSITTETVTFTHPCLPGARFFRVVQTP